MSAAAALSTAENLLVQVREAGVNLWIENGQLRYRMPKTAAAAQALEQVRLHKEQITASLRDAELPLEASAREKLGLNQAQEGPRFFPMRVEQIWRIEQRRDGHAPKVPFDIPYPRVLGSGIDVEKLRESIATVVRRHDALRGRLAVENGRPVQVVAKQSALECDVVTIARSDFQTGADLQEAMEQLSNPPIDLLSENGFRCRIFRDGKGNTALGMVLHHYFCDQWSVRLLAREIDDCYLALTRREGPVLPAVINQYADYAVSQRQSLAADLSGNLNFWRCKLADAPCSRLPYDHVLDTQNMTALHFWVGSDLGSLLKDRARAMRVSFFIVLLAAYQILLSRWTGERRVLNAVSVADRFDAKLSNTIGYLITALPICSTVSDEMTMTSFMENLSATMADAYSHRDLSYELYDEIFSPPQPFCTTLFNYIALEQLATAPAGAKDSSDEATPISLGNTFKRKLHHRELYFEMIEVSQGIRGRVFFNTDFFKRESVEAFLRQYRKILAQIATQPGSDIGQLG